ncbi:MAG: hypothetical protein OXF26_14760 [Alphaproteobacteria bacterium]|nr:hypothetical protein [Alphaproteobacteria bacterium]MCY4319520.1 hypothetical protein [Alphaproteobacteria bacterium]
MPNIANEPAILIQSPAIVTSHDRRPTRAHGCALALDILKKNEDQIAVDLFKSCEGLALYLSAAKRRDRTFATGSFRQAASVVP